MKLYQKFLTKILLTHRSTLHNADTIYNKKKKITFDRITRSTISKGQLNLTQIHAACAPAQLISKSNRTGIYSKSVIYYTHVLAPIQC